MAADPPMRRVLGSELRPGQMVRVWNTLVGRIVNVDPYVVPAKILIPSVAAKHPDGLPGRLVDCWPSCVSFTAFDDDEYEVYDEEAAQRGADVASVLRKV